MRQFAVLIALAGALAGCASSAEIQAANTEEDDAACRAYGAKPGSDAYVNCRTIKDQQRAAHDTAIRAALLAATTPKFAPDPGPVELPPPPHY